MLLRTLIFVAGIVGPEHHYFHLFQSDCQLGYFIGGVLARFQRHWIGVDNGGISQGNLPMIFHAPQRRNHLFRHHAIIQKPLCDLPQFIEVILVQLFLLLIVHHELLRLHSYFCEFLESQGARVHLSFDLVPEFMYEALEFLMVGLKLHLNRVDSAVEVRFQEYLLHLLLFRELFIELTNLVPHELLHLF